MKALVTGGAGFIGSHIVDQLLEKDINVVIVDYKTSKRNEWKNSNVTIYQMDISEADMEQIFANERPDIIYHLAAQISVAKSMFDPKNDAKSNILGTIHLLQCAVKYNVEKFIFASSAAVYGKPNYLPIDESHPVGPTSFYGLSKAASERYIQLYGELFDLNYCILRFANVYGPRQTTDGEAGVIPIFLNRLFADLLVKIYGDGTQTRDFIFVKDVADACYRASALTGSHILNIGSGTMLSINSLVKILIEQTGVSIMTNYQPSKSGDILHSCLLNQLARNVLKWEPNYIIADGIKETYIHIANKKQRSSRNNN